MTQHYWPYYGGAAVMLRHLAKRWIGDGHTVEVLTTRSEDDYPARDVLDGIPVTRLDRPRMRGVGMLRLMARVRDSVIRKRGEVDVVVASILQHMTAAAVDGAIRAGVPAVGRTEGAGVSGDVGWAERARFGRRVRGFCYRAGRIVAVSPEIETELVGSGYPAERVDLVPNGVPIPDRPWDRTELPRFRSALGVDATKVLCFTGRLRVAKGLPELLVAVRALHDRGLACHLLLVGDGSDKELLQRRAVELGLGSHVTFTGWRDDVEPFLRASDVFVLPSHVEGRSTALLEALALGMPALASDIDANRGLVPAEFLPLTPVGDAAALSRALAERLGASTDWSEAGRRCRELVTERHSIDRAARDHIRTFRAARAAA